MTPPDRDTLHLEHMAQCARDVLEFTAAGKADFLGDRKTQAAVLRSLEVMGEAVKRLSPALRDSHPHVRWKKMAGMRDVLIHQYDFLDLDEVWSVVEDEIPRVLREIESILKARAS